METLTGVRDTMDMELRRKARASDINLEAISIQMVLERETGKIT